MIKILLLAGNTLRAKTYAQQLQNIDAKSFEIKGLFYGFKKKDCIVPGLNIETEQFIKNQDLFIPDFRESLKDTFKANKWTYTMVDSIDVNSEEIIDEIKKSTSDIVIFAGYGGQLLKQEHFLGYKKYLHMHPGRLPLERGSTTIYYSILNQRRITVTAFFMTAKIDAGKNIIYSEYNIPTKGVDIDDYYDNVVRADCLIKALCRIQKNKFAEKPEKESEEEYYVIHPVLKHVALLSLNYK